MAKITSAKENEEAILADLEKETELELDPTHPDNFNIVHGRPLPEGFENPPKGDPGHFCLDRGGYYMSDWVQIEIQSVHDKQTDPQLFPLSSTWAVPLDTWCDVPPEVLESLVSAVETRHTSTAKPGTIDVGEEIVMTSKQRKRFAWSMMPSAKPSV